MRKKIKDCTQRCSPVNNSMILQGLWGWIGDKPPNQQVKPSKKCRYIKGFLNQGVSLWGFQFLAFYNPTKLYFPLLFQSIQNFLCTYLYTSLYPICFDWCNYDVSDVLTVLLIVRSLLLHYETRTPFFLNYAVSLPFFLPFFAVFDVPFDVTSPLKKDSRPANSSFFSSLVTSA